MSPLNDRIKGKPRNTMDTKSAPRLIDTHFVPFRETHPIESDPIAILLNKLHTTTYLNQLQRQEMKFYNARVKQIADEYRSVQFHRKPPDSTKLKETQLRTIRGVCDKWKYARPCCY
jgi:predicted Zn-dependent protease